MKKLISVLAICFASATSASTITVANHSFEDAPTGSGGITSHPVSPLPGWSTGNVETVASNFWTASDGAQSIDLNGVQPGWISQTLSGFTIGGLYTLTFDLGGNYYGASSHTMSASIAGTSGVFSHSPAIGDTIQNFTWVEESLSFFATSTSHLLTFTQLSAGNAAGAALDNIRVTGDPVPSPVPLPASALLLLGGLGGLGLMRRLKKS